MTKRTITATQKNLDEICIRRQNLGLCEECSPKCAILQTIEMLKSMHKSFDADEKFLQVRVEPVKTSDIDGNEYFGLLI